MKLKDLLRDVRTLKIAHVNIDLGIAGISCHVSSVKKRHLFVAIKGSNADGHKFISGAIKKGAKAVVVENRKYFNSIKEDITVIHVKDSRKALAQIAANFYGHPSRKIKVIGITGTNGKTTVSFVLESILKTAGFKVGVIGTINYRFNKKIYSCANTTPGALTVQSYLNRMVEAKVDYAIIEVSSHALDQDRVTAVKFSSAIFTNLSQDHLDYHKTKQAYFMAKAKLFKMLPADSSAVINNDDRLAQKLTHLTVANISSYGIKSGNIRANNINLHREGVDFNVVAASSNILINSRLLGLHNVYNILAVAACALSLGIKAKDIKKGISRLRSVPGRLESIDTKSPYKVFIDYAHTEDGLKRALDALKRLYHNSKIISVFGCGGNRDKTKRPKMGKVTSILSDYVIITSDNPRNESAKNIAHQVSRGIKKKNFKIILDRREAIKKSLILADSNTVVLIAGKGHEKYQVVGNRKIPFDDKKIATKYMQSLK